jgi:NAD(P)-dependent dehydrogenase (short-subunit alcohol dehydrogenase family)
MARLLDGKVAIVTGAGSVGEGIGNGKATAIVFAREGAKVALVDRNLAAAEETRSIIEKEGGTSYAVAGDVSDPADCRKIVESCVAKYGGVDVLHNNVGIEIAGGLESQTLEDWNKTLAVNLTSMFLMCKEAVPRMVARGGGSVINVSSINSIRTLPAISLAYGVSKAGVNAMSRELAIEYAKTGVRINAILPGMMNTPFVRVRLAEAYGGDISEMTKFRDAKCPTGKQGEPWDVANLALFLASDLSKYITGQELVVDGAPTCRM